MPRAWGDGGGAELYDGGGAWERTSMSWQRTALALGVNGLLVVRAGTHGSPWVLVLGLAVSVGALVLWAVVAGVYGRHRHQPRRYFLLGPMGARWCPVALVGVVLVTGTTVLAELFG